MAEDDQHDYLRMHKSYANLMADEAFTPPGFRLKLGMKDINLVLETAASSQDAHADQGVCCTTDGFRRSRRAAATWIGPLVALDVDEDAGLKKKGTSA